MTMSICSVFDSKAESWHSPMVFQAVPQASRSFGDAVNQKDSDFNKHPEDYALFHLGEFDDETGNLFPLKSPEVICTGVSVMRVQS